jgi:hypothetical protein
MSLGPEGSTELFHNIIFFFQNSNFPTDNSERALWEAVEISHRL